MQKNVTKRKKCVCVWGGGGVGGVGVGGSVLAPLVSPALDLPKQTK